MQAPISKNVPVFLITAGLTVAAAWLNSKFFTTPNSMTPEFKAEAARIGPVMVRNCYYGTAHHRASIALVPMQACSGR